jgi:two-component system sensor histidine kinase YesM
MRERISISVRTEFLLSVVFIYMMFVWICTGFALFGPDGGGGQRKMLYILFVSMALFLAFFLTYAYYALKRPYRRWCRILEDFMKGLIFDELFQMDDELAPGVKGTLNELKFLLNKQKQLRLDIDQSKYLALQNQINPHFLYNTLDAIRADALVAGMGHVADITEALATFFAYSISNLDKYATLSEEIRNIKDYFTIQQYRFGGLLNMQVHIEGNEKEVLKLYMPRMTLQPIVENAILHGLECKSELGSVCIYVQRTQHNLLINVVDDGVGMPEEAVDKLNDRINQDRPDRLERSNDSRGGIALKNVNSRIKLLFGEEYGIHIYSQIDIGTDVRITLPVVKEREQNHEYRISQN